MTDADELAEVSRRGFEPAAPRADLRRAVIGVLVIVAVFIAAGFAVYHERHAFLKSLARIGPPAIVASFVAATVSTYLAFLVWRRVLVGLQVDLPRGPSARLYFISQLGKYLPGSVWPVLMQMEAGRSHGASRRTMLTANLVSLILGCTAGLLVAAVLLPFSAVDALSRYWWLLLVIPLLLALLHPRAIPYGLDWVWARLRRPPLGERVHPRENALATGWSVASFGTQGIHLALLVLAIHGGGASTIVLCIGAMGLAVPAGVLFVPAPAGAGVRDVVLIAVLGSTLGPGQALAVVVASRGILIAADLVLAALAAASYRRARGLRARQPTS